MKAMHRVSSWMACLGMVAAVAISQIGCEDDGGDSGDGSHDFGENDPALIVALGDSLTYGYGQSASETYPAQLSAMTGRPVVNSGVTGETSAGGLSRVNGVLRSRKPGYLLIMYGANDIIQGVELESTVERLRGIIQAAKANQTIPIIGTVTPTFTKHDHMIPGIEAINPMIKEMARQERTRVANTYGAVNDIVYYLDDGLHHTAEGAGRLASAFADRL